MAQKADIFAEKLKDEERAKQEALTQADAKFNDKEAEYQQKLAEEEARRAALETIRNNLEEQ